MKPVHREPGGQAALYESEGRYTGILTEIYGQPFTDYRAKWRESSGRAGLGDFPLSLDLAINSGCQLSCLMCPLKSRPYGGRVRLMDDDLFRRILDQAREHRLPAMTLGLGSEPLLNPKAAQWAAAAERAGIMDIRLGSNGLALYDDAAKALVDSGLTRLEISVDAARPETYAAIRGGSLDILERKIERFLAIRNSAAQKLPLLRLSFLKLPLNRGELEPFLKRWRGLADMLSIQEAIWFPGSALSEPNGPRRAIFPLCAQPWQRLAINYDGGLWPCCSWYGEGLLPFSAKKDNLAAVWISAEMASLRCALKDPAAPPAACEKCGYQTELAL